MRRDKGDFWGNFKMRAVTVWVSQKEDTDKELRVQMIPGM